MELGGFQPAGSVEPGGGWQWLNNEGPFSFTAWASNQPDNAGAENYLHYINHLPEWNDITSTTTWGIASYVVEFDGDPTFANVLTPSATPPAGTYDGDVAVTLETPTNGAVIHYTTDGTVPTASSAIYQTPILLTSTTTIRVRAYRDGLFPSQSIAFPYILRPTLL